MKLIHVLFASTLLASPALAAGQSSDQQSDAGSRIQWNQQSSDAASSGSQMKDQGASNVDSSSSQSKSQQASSHPPLASPDQMKQIQQKLADEGFDPGQVDGVWGPRTQQALQQFQQDRGLEGQGVLDQQTLAELNVDIAPGQDNQTAQVPEDDTLGTSGSPSDRPQTGTMTPGDESSGVQGQGNQTSQ